EHARERVDTALAIVIRLGFSTLSLVRQEDLPIGFEPIARHLPQEARTTEIGLAALPTVAFHELTVELHGFARVGGGPVEAPQTLAQLRREKAELRAVLLLFRRCDAQSIAERDDLRAH